MAFENFVSSLLFLFCFKDYPRLKDSPVYGDALNKRYPLAITVLGRCRLFYKLRNHNPEFGDDPLHKVLFIHIVDILVLDVLLIFNALVELQPATENLWLLSHSTFFVKWRDICQFNIWMAT